MSALQALSRASVPSGAYAFRCCLNGSVLQACSAFYRQRSFLATAQSSLAQGASQQEHEQQTPSGSSQQADPGLSVESALKQDNVTLVDVRTAKEFATGSVPGALNLPVQTIPERLEDLPPDVEVTHCALTAGHIRRWPYALLSVIEQLLASRDRRTVC